jgi:hypothetical protein
MVLGAENLPRIKLFAEVGDPPQGVMVGERFICCEAVL